ncbi:hypothetical protein ABWH97_10665 [Nitratireductor sp. ac15]
MRSVQIKSSLPILRGGLATLILLALVLFPFGGVHPHVAPQAVAGGLSSDHAVSYAQGHAHGHDDERAHEHNDSDGEASRNEAAGAECCMFHCMPLASLKYEQLSDSRFAPCFAASSMLALSSSLPEKPRKPPRS